jgi:AcrR family transcriptional regulator
MIELVRAGNPAPSAEAVSRQADVSLRTVFRHFDDMDSLYQEMSAVVEAEILPFWSEPLPQAPWPELLTELVARRARVFERIMPFKLAGNVRRHQSELLERRHRDLNAIQRRVLESVLPARFRSDPLLLEALDLLLCFESWHRLRSDQGLSVAKARSVLRAACLGLTTTDE